MARCIDADALSIYFDALIKHAEMEGLYNMAHVYERCLQIVKDAPAADVAPRAEWISVEERLPESLQRVLAINTEGDMFTAVYISFVTGKNAWSTSYSCLGVVTHWMPMPEPPKGD